MSGTAAAGQPARTRNEAARGEPDGPHRPRRWGWWRWWRWAAAGLVAAGLAAGVAAAGADGASARPGAASARNPYPTATATVTVTVTRRSLTAQTQVQATLGEAGSYAVVNQAAGTITALPAVGQVVPEGQALYQVSGYPVVLLYGSIPAYRALSEGMSGADVTELNHDLVRLGYATSTDLAEPGWDYFGWDTQYAVERLQTKLGETATGAWPLGQAVFLPSAIQVTALGQATALGGTAIPGAALFTGTSTSPVVTIDLDPAQQTQVKHGDHVSITLPDGATTPGVISSVGTVATTPSSGSSTGSGGSAGSGSTSATITVEVTLGDPKAADGLTQAPVTVTITTASVSNALVVPVTALLAQAGGSYAVEVTSPGGQHQVPVSTGLFDDADGLVQVTGPGLAAGQHVVVPAP